MGMRIDLGKQVMVVMELQSESQIDEFNVIGAMRSYFNYFGIVTFQIVSEVAHADDVLGVLAGRIGQDDTLKKAGIDLVPCFELRRDGTSLVDPEPWKEAGAAAAKWQDRLRTKVYGIEVEQLFAKQMPGHKYATLGPEVEEIDALADALPPGRVMAYPGIWSTGMGKQWDTGVELRQIQFWTAFAAAFRGSLMLSRSKYCGPKAFQASERSAQRVIDAVMGQISADNLWRVFAVANEIKLGDDPKWWPMGMTLKVIERVISDEAGEWIELYPGMGAGRLTRLVGEMVQAFDAWGAGNDER